MNNLVSIVVPFYNAGNFLDKCIKSIVNQSYSNYELILVNNNSTDNSYDIAKTYEGNPKVKIINCETQGVSYTRNMGVKESTGKWLLFVDADDYLEETMLEDMIACVDKASDKIQCVEVGFFDEDLNGNILKSNYNSGEKKNFRKKEILEDLFDSTVGHYQGYLWNKLLLLDIVKSNNIVFDTEIHYNEDRLFLTKYFYYADEEMKCVYLPKAYYHYVQHENSAMGRLKTQSVTKVITEIKAFENMNNLLKKSNYEVVVEKLSSESLNSCLNILKNVSFNNAKTEKEYIKKYINSLKVKGIKAKIKLFICKNKILLSLYKVIK